MGDVNGDGKPDLATANGGSNVWTVSVLPGNGDGTFATKTDFGAGSRPWSVAIGDVNGDGKPDLATANYGSNTVSVLLNIGQGTSGVIPGREPRIARLLAPKPNPSRSTTTIDFDSPASALVDLEILDISGRLTRVLSSGVKYAAGRRSLTWDGHDDTGRPVASGVYFVRLQAGWQRDTQKILMLK